MPRLITGLDAARIRANLDRIRGDIADAGREPGEVEILAAVKYVALEEIGVLGEAGLTLLGENRAQELEAKASAHPEFRWHFIGQLQSRKVKSILPYVELIHSVASESASAQLERHGDADTRDPARGQRRGRGRKGRDRPRGARRATSRRAPVRVDGLMTMPPFAEHPESSRPAFRRVCASSPPNTA